MTTRRTVPVAVLMIMPLVMLTGSAVAYEFNDVQWDAEIFPIPYRVNATGAPEGFAGIVEECVNQWHQVVASSLSFRYGGLTGLDGTENRNGFNTIAWDEEGEYLDADVIAQTFVRTADYGFIVECDTVFNGSIAWSTTGSPGDGEYDLKTAVLREIGRWVQLDFVAAPSQSVMVDPLAAGVVKDTLSQDDVDAISTIYPAPHEPDAWEPRDNDPTGATLLELSVTQSDHNIFPYDDEDWYRFDITEPASLKIATSGQDPLGDTEIYLYRSPPGPVLRLPATDSVLNDDNSYEFRAGVGEGIVSIGDVLYHIAPQDDILLGSGNLAPIDASNSDIFYTLVAAENGGATSVVVIAGTAAPLGVAAPPSADDINTAIGHANWISLGNTQIHRIDEAYMSQTVTPVITEPIGHADNVDVPELTLPATNSIINADGSYEFRVNITDGVIAINNSFYNVLPQSDILVASGGSSPFTDVNTNLICSVAAVENAGVITLNPFSGASAPADSAAAPTVDDLTTAIGHANWVLIGSTRFSLDESIVQTNTTTFESHGTSNNIEAELKPPTTPSTYDQNGTHKFRVNINAGRVRINGTVLWLNDKPNVKLSDGLLTSPFDLTNTSIVYTIVAFQFSTTSLSTIVTGNPAPRGLASAPSDGTITGQLGHEMWARIGNVQIDVATVRQGIEETLFDRSQTASPLYAILEAPGLVPGTYYVKVQSSIEGGQPVVDPYSIALLPGSVDAFEWDNLNSGAKRIYPDETQVRTISPAGDVDWAYFVLAEEAHVVIETFGPEGGDTELLLLGTEGTIAYNDDKDQEGGDFYSKIDVPKLAAGKYYIKVNEVRPWEELISYTLEFHPSPPVPDLYEQDNTPQQAAELARELKPYEAQLHSIDPIADHDWMYFYLEEPPPDEVNIETSGPFGDDTYMELYDADILTDPLEAPIATDDNSGDGAYARITVTGLATGQYFVLVRQKNDDALIEEYHVVLVPAQLCDIYEHDNSSSSAKVITPGVPMQHCLKPGGDVDWAKFTLPTSGDLVIETSGDPKGDTKMWLYYYDNGELDLRGYNDDIDYDNFYSRIEYEGATAGTWYIQVQGWDTSEVIDAYSTLLTYDEHLREPNDPGDIPQNALEIFANEASRQHTISPLEDIDWFMVEITGLLDFEIQVAGLGELEVMVFGSSILASPDPNAEPPAAQAHAYGEDSVQLRYVVPAPDTYYIKVNELGTDARLLDYQIIARVAIQTDFNVRPPWLLFEGSWQDPPAPKTVTIKLAEHLTHTTTWSSQTTADWIIVTPNSGPVAPGQPVSVEIAVAITQLPAGQYVEDVTFTPDDGNPPFNLEVAFKITKDPANMDWDPDQLVFFAIEGGINPPSQEITIINEGGGDFVSWSIDADKPWVDIAPASGALYEADPSETITITPDITDRAPGQHITRLTLHGFEANPGVPPARPPIFLTVAIDTVPPYPVSFQHGPRGVAGTDSIRMTTFATSDEQQGPVEYRFQFYGGDAGGADSLWISSTTFTLSGLVPGGYYTYRVKARDTNSNFNETAYSAKMSGYVAPATPSAPAVGSPGQYSLQVTPSRGANSERVQLAIYNANEDTYVGRLGEQSSSPVWRTEGEWGTVEALKLQANTQYTFHVIARNGQGLQSAKSPGGSATTLADTAAERPLWDPASPTAVTSGSISLRIVSTTGTQFEFLNVTTGQSSGWTTSLDYTFQSLLPCSHYEFKAHAKNAIGNVGNWSVPLRMYTLPLDPADPVLIPGIIESVFVIDPNTNDNPNSTAYAIQVGLDKFVDRDGTASSAVKVWLPEDQWLATALQGFHGSPDYPTYQFRIFARNPDGRESANPSSNVDRMVDFQPPTPNPARMAPSRTWIGDDFAYIYAVECIDANGKEYYFESVDGPFEDSGWQTDDYHVFPATVRGITALFRVKYRDFAGNETAWSGPAQVPISPVVPGTPILKGTWLTTAYFSIDPGLNAPTAEYAIKVGTVYLGGANTLVSKAVWRTMPEWDYITAIKGLIPPTTIQVRVLVRRAGDLTVQLQSNVVSIEVTGAADTIAPQPDDMRFEGPPTAKGATWMTLTAIEATDGETWVMYGFRRGAFATEWSWTRTYTARGLNPASTQTFYVIAKDGGRNTNKNGWSGPLFAWTLAAIPNAPVVTPHTSTIDLTIDRNGNPSTVKCAIYDSMLDRYLASDRTLTSTTPVWKSTKTTGWGTTLTIIGVQPGSTHLLQVKAKNPENIETEFSPAVEAKTVINDTQPPIPNPAEFAANVIGTSTSSFKARAIVSIDYTDPVQYYFTVTSPNEVDAYDSGWQTSTLFEPGGLTPGGKYVVSVRARDSVVPTPNQTASSGQATVYVNPLPPGAPVASNIGYSGVTLAFATGANSTQTLYAVFASRTGLYVNALGALASVVPVWRSKAEWGSSLAVSGLEPGNTYYFAAVARSKDEVASPYSNETTVATLFDDLDPPSPNPAAFASPPAATGTSSFRAQAAVASDYTRPVEWAFDFEGPEGIIPGDWGTSRLFEPTGLIPGAEYTVVVRARDSAIPPNVTGDSASATVYVDPEMPGAPAASNIDTSSVTLSFATGANSSEALYAVFESTTDLYVDATGALTSAGLVWRSADDWGADPGFSVTGLSPGASHLFSVVASSKDGGTSPYSAETEVVTLSSDMTRPGPPAVPANLLGSVSLMLQLDGLGTWGPADTFLIRATAATSQYVQADGSLGPAEVWQTLNQWGNPVCIHSLDGDTVYTFDVRANVGGDLSEWGVPLENVLTDIPGDATGDDTVNILDMIYVRNILNAARCSGEAFKGDVTDDGVVNILDMIFIRNHLNDTR